MISRRILSAVALLCALAAPLHAQTGSQKTLAQMNTEIAVNLPTTGNKAISALTVRQTLVDLTASVAFLNGTVPFTAPVSAPSYKIGADIVLTHPLTPNPDNIPNTLITLGVGAGASLAPIHSTQYDTLVGYNAGAFITTADHISAFGAFACAAQTVGGPPSGPSNGSFSNTCLGIDTMRAATSAQGNVAVGEHSQTFALTLLEDTAIGVNSMLNAGGRGNTATGFDSMIGAPAPNTLTGGFNTANGYGTLGNIATIAQQNSAFGAFAGGACTTCQLNIFVGYGSGPTQATGIGNILIGTNVDTPFPNTNNYLNIGGWVFGDAANNVRFLGSIGTKPPLNIPTGTSGTAGSDDSSVIINPTGSFTLTLPSAATSSGRWLYIKNIASQTISSASSNVGPLTGGAAGTAILAATIGKWAILQSNGVYWDIMAAN